MPIYPPGPHYDEAAELLIARSIAFGGARFFPMVEAYQGREVLYYYLSVPLLTFVNDGMFSLRVLSVFCNLITIAASMALGRAMFRGRRGVIVGLAVGVLMTLSFPMIWLSRQAFRSSALPMMQALALLFLWKGLRAATARRAVPLLVVGGRVRGRGGLHLQLVAAVPVLAADRRGGAALVRPRALASAAGAGRDLLRHAGDHRCADGDLRFPAPRRVLGAAERSHAGGSSR